MTDNEKAKLEDLLEEDETIAEYSITGDYVTRYCIIGNSSDDINAALEETLHRLLEAGSDEADVYAVMGAKIPEEDEWKELYEYDEYSDIDLGYVIPGLIESFRIPGVGDDADAPLRQGIRACLMPFGGRPEEVMINPKDSLHEMQGYVDGLIEPLDVRDDGICLYVNEEGLFTKRYEPNRAFYASKYMEETGYLSQIDGHSVKEGELYAILFGPVLAVTYNEEGELADLTPGQLQTVKEEFSDPGSGMEAYMDLRQSMAKDRLADVAKGAADVCSLVADREPLHGDVNRDTEVR